MPLTFATLYERSHQLAVEKGWWQNTDITDANVRLAKLALIHSELSEAHEEFQRDRMYEVEDAKPLGALIELADVVIRCADLVVALGYGPLHAEADVDDKWPGDDYIDISNLHSWVSLAVESCRDGDTMVACYNLNMLVEEICLLAPEKLGMYLDIKDEYNCHRTHRHGGRLA